MEVTREVSQSSTLGPGLGTVLIHHVRKIRPLEVTELPDDSGRWNQELPVKVCWKVLQICVAGWQNGRWKSLTGQCRQYNHLPPYTQNNWINKHHTIKSPRCNLGQFFWASALWKCLLSVCQKKQRCERRVKSKTEIVILLLHPLCSEPCVPVSSPRKINTKHEGRSWGWPGIADNWYTRGGQIDSLILQITEETTGLGDLSEEQHAWDEKDYIHYYCKHRNEVALH